MSHYLKSPKSQPIVNSSIANTVNKAQDDNIEVTRIVVNIKQALTIRYHQDFATTFTEYIMEQQFDEKSIKKDVDAWKHIDQYNPQFTNCCILQHIMREYPNFFATSTAKLDLCQLLYDASNGKLPKENVKIQIDDEIIKQYASHCSLPKHVLQTIMDYLNAIYLFFTEPMCITLRYNDGNDASQRYGNQSERYKEIEIVFDSKHDANINNEDLLQNERVGMVSQIRIVSGQYLYSSGYDRVDRAAAPLICEISNKSYPITLMGFMNCDVHKVTKQRIQQIDETEDGYTNSIEIKLKKGDIKFRKSIIIPNDKVLNIYNNDDSKQKFVIENQYKQPRRSNKRGNKGNFIKEWSRLVVKTMHD